MKSYEVIRQAVVEHGVKAVAAALKLSPALVYKWCEPPAAVGSLEQSGAKNPLDRIREMYLLTRDIRLIRWLCNEADGFFVANVLPELRVPMEKIDQTIFTETRGMVRDFSALLEAVNRSMEDDRRIDAAEAEHIRQRWEDLKSCCERFVLSCEKGLYRDS